MESKHERCYELSLISLLAEKHSENLERFLQVPTSILHTVLLVSSSS